MPRSRLLAFAAATVRFYFRTFPVVTGKVFVWDHIVRPYIAWRDIPLVADTTFGVAFSGNMRNLIDRYLYLFGYWEPGITATLHWHLRPGDHVIDIGANVGAHCLLAARLVGPGGLVHAIEASPGIFDRLCANIRNNGITQVRPINVAVSDRTGTVKVYLHSADNLGATTVIAEEAAQRGGTVEAEVAAEPLDRIVELPEIRRTRLVKIDVEGAEWLVLNGMRPLLDSFPDDCMIIVEVNREALDRDGIGFDGVLAMMREAGWLPAEIINSYHPDFYLRPTGPVVRRLPADPPAVLDVAFLRPGLHASLLASALGEGA